MELNQNEFLANLVNVIVYTRVNRTVKGRRINDLIDHAMSDATEYGDGKLLITADTLDVEEYSQTSTLLSNKPPKVNEQVLSTTDRKFIHLTLNRYLMRGAFANEYSLDDAFSAIEEMLTKTKDIFTYKKIVKAYEDWTPKTSTQTIKVKLIPTTTEEGAAEDLTGDALEAAEKQNAIAVYKAIRKASLNMQVPSRAFNDIGYEEMYNAEDLDLIINDKYETDVNTYAYASLLNSDKLNNIQLYDKSIIVPNSQMSDENKTKVIGYLVSKGKYQISTRFVVSTEFFDGSNLNLQRFLHFWYISGIADGLAGVKLEAEFVGA